MHELKLFAWPAPKIHRKDASLNSTSIDSPVRRSASVHAISGWRRAVMWALAPIVRLWGMTLRFDMTAEDIRNCSKDDVPVAFVLWHNRLFITTEVHRRFRAHRPMYALISASKDGAVLTAFFAMVSGMKAVRGSSSNFGREAASALVEVQRAGHDIGITPDGPRGPCYELKPGAIIIPRRSGAPLLLLGGEFESAWQMKSWDRFYLPKPFSRVRVRCELIENNQLADRDAAAATIQSRLLALNPDRPARSPDSA